MDLSTHWSQIEQLQGRATADAWQWFIDRYRGFVTAALRRLIWSPDRAAAAGDEFWGYLFQSGAVERVPREARFRAFLVSTLRNYAQAWMRRNPRVRSGDGDERPAEPTTPLPEDEEVALWARQVLHLALHRLDREQPRWARAVRAFYGLPETADAAPVPPRPATSIAEELGCTTNSLHQMLFRGRARLRDCVVEEVRQTVSNGRDLESELQVLLSALGSATPGIVPGPAAPDPS